jgi:hypothetical protein
MSALDGDAEGHLPLRSRRDLGELDFHSRCDVCTARAAHPPADAEEVVTEERGEEVGETAEVEGTRLEAAAAEPGVTEAVVQLTPLGVRQDLVRLNHLAETLFRVGGVGDVGMQLARKPTKSTLDVVGAGGALDAEQLVVVALGAQLSS